MVSFNRDSANGQFFPLEPRSRTYHCRTNLSIGAFRRSQVWLAQVTVTWNQLLSSVGDLQVSTSAHVRSPRNFVCTQPDFAKMVISILNRFQLVIWMHESQAENLDNKEKFEERLIRIQESLQRDLVRLRKLVSESSFQSRQMLRTADLAEQLEVFFRRLCS